jgi:hypothetical protein
MEVSKIHLSSSEFELMQNADIILTKNSVLQKMKLLLEEVQDMQIEYSIKSNFQDNDLFKVSPKISRGENYLGLPWLILDYPRISNPGDLFFIRTMFWWGKFFSTTLHVSGKHKENILEKISSSYQLLQKDFIGVNTDPWSHHFEENNYSLISSISEPAFKSICEELEHLKIASYWPLSQWQQAPSVLFKKWKQLLELSGSIS